MRLLCQKIDCEPSLIFAEEYGAKPDLSCYNEIMISIENLLEQIASGEDSSRQFKADVRNAESLASEMAAFANSEGGTLFIGVADDGSVPGLTSKRQIEAFL